MSPIRLFVFNESMGQGAATVFASLPFDTI